MNAEDISLQEFGHDHERLTPTKKFDGKSGFAVSRWSIVYSLVFTLGIAAIVAVAVEFGEADSCVCKKVGSTTPDPGLLTTRPTRTIPPSVPSRAPASEGTTCPPVSTPDPVQAWDICLDQSQSMDQCMPGIPDCPDDSNYRIPKRLIPTHYSIELKPNIYSGNPDNFTYNGWIDIDMTCEENTDTIYFHYRDMDIEDDSVHVVDADNKSIPVTGTARDTIQEFYIVYLDRTVRRGNTIHVHLAYRGFLNHIAKGISWNRYLDGNLQEKYHLSTQLQSTDARRAFPCMDEPELKATFTLSIWRKTGFVSLFNSEISHTNSTSDDWHIDVYDPSPRMSSYLVAFMVGEFSKKTSTSINGYRVNIWAPTDWINSGFADYTNLKSYPIIDYYDDLFQVRYPLRKLDQSVATDYGGAMENWGMIFYRTAGLMTHPGWGSLDEKRNAISVIGHEILHQWFGDLVTCKWWEDTWLNEGFAAYYENWPWEKVEPEWDREDSFVTGRYLRAMKLDDQGDLSPIHDQTIADVTEVANAFGQQSYSKGACLLRMMNELVMQGNWNKVLHEYLSSNQYGSGTDVLFFAALDQIVDEENLNFEVSPSEVMKTWLYQTGVPVVTISRRVGTSTVDISQKMFLINPYVNVKERYPSPFNYKWEIPISMISIANPFRNTIQWLHKNDRVVDLRSDLGIALIDVDDWILGNYRAMGYYRTNYDDGNWQALIKQLKINHTVIPPANRGMLLNDALYLSRAEELDIVTALQLTEYLVTEREWVPLDMFVDGTEYIDGMIRTHQQYDLFRTYMRNLWNTTFEELGFIPRAGEENVLSTMFLRRRTVRKSCYYGHEDCITDAIKLVTDWMANPDDFSIIHPDVRGEVLCAAMENIGGQDEWDFLFERYQYFARVDDFTSMRANIRDALSCSRQSFILSSYFDMAIQGDPRILSSDRSSIVQAIARNPIGQPIAWDYLNENWETASYRSSIFSAATELYKTYFDLGLLDEFYKDHKAGSDSEQKTMDDRRIYVQANIRWIERNEQNLFLWLQGVISCLPPCPRETVEDEPIGSLRLPEDWKPTHYDIEIIPDFYQTDPSNNVFTGHVDIHLQCVNLTNQIVFQFRDMTIDSVYVKASTGSNLTITEQEEDNRREFYTITLDTQVSIGEEVIVVIDYSGKLTNTPTGMYWVAFPDPDQGITRYQLATQFASTDARKAFPCLDEPAMKATFNLIIWRKLGFVAIANMPLESTENKGNDWFADTFQKFDQPISTYLVAYSIVDGFNHTDRSSTLGFLTRQWTQNRFIKLGFADYADRITAPILDLYSAHFKNTYPLPKEDQITVAGKGGAMENWGLITYSYLALLYDPEISTEAEKERVALVVAHEDLHQWFGNLITCSWWTDIWINEASASYFEFLGMEVAEPEWKVDQIMVKTNLWVALEFDSYGRSHPIHNPAVNTPSEIDAMFSRVTYEKGSVVLRMMDKLVMKSLWNTSMEAIIKIYQYSSLDNTEYTAVLDQVATNHSLELDGVSPSIVMNTWLDQMGYPVVTVILRHINNRTDVEVTQALFLIDKERPVQDEKYPSVEYKWEIPVDVISNTQPFTPQRWWLHQDNAIFTYDQHINWVVANYGLHGFYRVNYDRSTWDAIIAQLNTNHTVIHEGNRAQLIEDGFNLARAELLTLEVGLDTTAYLSSERDYLPWAATERTLSYVRLMLKGSRHYENFRIYILNLARENYARLGWEERPGDSHFDIYLRSIILQLMCSYDSTECILEAQSRFNSWMSTPTDMSIVGPNVRDAVYCTVIRNSINNSDWTFLFERYTHYKEQDHFSRIRSSIIRALSCSRDQSKLTELYDMAYRGDMRIHSSDRNLILTNIARNPIANHFAWRYLDSRWDTHPFRTGVLGALTESLKRQEDLNQIEKFFHRHPASSGDVQNTYNDRRMVIRANIRWWNNYENTLKTWFFKTFEP